MRLSDSCLISLLFRSPHRSPCRSKVFTEAGYMPYVGSTKSLSGHALGAAGVHEAIYSLLMMRDGE